MTSSPKRRTLGLIAVVLTAQALTACVVVPVPAHRHRAVVVQPGYGHPPPPPRDYHEPYWRR